MTQAEHFAVVGNPIAHSRSPEIHQQFAEQFGHTIIYRRWLLEEDNFDAEVEHFFKVGGKGLNVTVPFKQQAYQLAAELDDYAVAAQAVNTLWQNKNGQLCGANTDGLGLVADFKAKNVPMADSDVLMIGAGGATRGALLPLLRERPRSITVANRTLSKADALKAQFKQAAELERVNMSACSLAAMPSQAFDLIINATSASLSGGKLPLTAAQFSEDTVAYDMVYASEQTVFEQQAAMIGCSHVYNGLGMLVQQAACSYQLWQGEMPDVSRVIL